jgi:hypothetical protein
MNFVHLINSIALMSLLVLFLVAQTVPDDIDTFDDIPQEKSLIGILKATRLEAGLHAKISIENFSKSKEIKQIALGIFLLNALFWPMACLFSTKRKDRITLEVNGGKVSFKVLALEESLRNSLSGDPQVKVRRVVVNPTGRNIAITAEVTLLETDSIQHMDARIIAHLKNHFEKIFPVQKPVSYEVVIGKLKPSGTPMGLQNTMPARKAPEPSTLATETSETAHKPLASEKTETESEIN